MNKPDILAEDCGPLPTWSAPMKMVLSVNGVIYTLPILNYHFLGAKLDVPKEVQHFFRDHSSHPNLQLDFYIGSKCIKSEIKFKVLKFDFEKSSEASIEFASGPQVQTRQSERLPTNEAFRVTLVGADPLDSNRKLFFSCLNISRSGMLLSTSLSNKHLFSGMLLSDAMIYIPGVSNHKVVLRIENARLSEKRGIFLIGVTFVNSSIELRAAFNKYLLLMRCV